MMMSRITRCAVYLALLAPAVASPLSVGAGARAYAAQAAAPIPAVAQRLQHTSLTGGLLAALAAAEIASVQETHYSHHGSIDHANGIYDTDCSGFVDDLLQQVAPDAYAELPVERGFQGPRAYLFEQFFADMAANGDQPGWTAVPSLVDAQPGDILAWSLEPFTPDSDTGHVVVIAAAPWRNDDGSYSVPVYDASDIRHGDDSRVPGVGGIGSGTISVRVDDGGAPVAFQFAPHDHWHSAPIAIGRLTDAG